MDVCPVSRSSGTIREIPLCAAIWSASFLCPRDGSPDLLAETRNRNAAEKRRQEDTEASASEKSFVESLIAMGADPETAVIEDMSRLETLISAATEPVVVVYFNNPLHLP